MKKLLTFLLTRDDTDRQSRVFDLSSRTIYLLVKETTRFKKRKGTRVFQTFRFEQVRVSCGTDGTTMLQNLRVTRYRHLRLIFWYLVARAWNGVTSVFHYANTRRVFGGKNRARTRAKEISARRKYHRAPFRGRSRRMLAE